MPPEIAQFLSGSVLLFLLFGTGALVAAIAMVLFPNPVRSALCLVLNLFCVAALYLLLNAYFLATVQVIVYAGAIMVLFLFVIMLLNLGAPDRAIDRLRWQQPVAIGVALVLASVFGAVVYESVPATEPSVQMAVPAAPEAPSDRPAYVQVRPDPDTMPPVTPDTMGTASGVGRNLYDPGQAWLFPFEATSILLLIAVIGAVVLAKRRLPGETDLATTRIGDGGSNE